MTTRHDAGSGGRGKMIRSTTAALVALLGTSAFAGEKKTWEGTWNNKLYGTSGTMKCVAEEGKDGVWTANFSGVFQGEKFSYDVTFDGKPGKGQTDLSGTATIRNHKYEWTGSIKGDTLRGKYKANSGYNGDFVLKEPGKGK
jgi:hypothetical protein